MKKVAVLGAGMVGSVIAVDLSANFDVTSFDINNSNFVLLNKFGVKTSAIDLSNSDTIKSAISDFDIVVGAVPGYMGYKTIKAVIEAGKDVVDISFFPEDSLELDQLAKQHNVTAIVDFGLAPGIGNLIVGYHNSRMQVDRFECYVGGLPFVRSYPFQYKAPFSPIDVIEEYTRLARYVENGLVSTRPALSDAELIDFPEVGTLEAFYTDGLRSLIKTMPHIPFMKEKTLRYPGHIQLISALMASGFFSDNPIEVNGTKIKPIEFTSKVLFNSWKLYPTDDEFTVMRIIIRGWELNDCKNYTYDLFDRQDKKTGFSSMARTTGFACTSAVNLLAKGMFTKKGISPPEFVGEDADCFNFVMNYMKERNVIYRMSECD